MTSRVLVPPYMNLGLSGTRRDPTKRQKEASVELVKRWQPLKVHHGDCTGFDIWAHWMVMSVVNRCDIHVYPPDNPRWRANAEQMVSLTNIRVTIHPEAPYLERDTTIVANSTALLACPSTVEEQTFSGTWATIRRARARRRPIVIIRPDGTVTKEGTWPSAPVP